MLAKFCNHNLNIYIKYEHHLTIMRALSSPKHTSPTSPYSLKFFFSTKYASFQLKKKSSCRFEPSGRTPSGAEHKMVAEGSHSIFALGRPGSRTSDYLSLWSRLVYSTQQAQPVSNTQIYSQHITTNNKQTTEYSL